MAAPESAWTAAADMGAEAREQCSRLDRLLTSLKSPKRPSFLRGAREAPDPATDALVMDARSPRSATVPTSPMTSAVSAPPSPPVSRELHAWRGAMHSLALDTHQRPRLRRTLQLIVCAYLTERAAFAPAPGGAAPAAGVSTPFAQPHHVALPQWAASVLTRGALLPEATLQAMRAASWSAGACDDTACFGPSMQRAVLALLCHPRAQLALYIQRLVGEDAQAIVHVPSLLSACMLALGCKEGGSDEPPGRRSAASARALQQPAQPTPPVPSVLPPEVAPLSLPADSWPLAPLSPPPEQLPLSPPPQLTPPPYAPQAVEAPLVDASSLVVPQSEDAAVVVAEQPPPVPLAPLAAPVVSVQAAVRVQEARALPPPQSFSAPLPPTAVPPQTPPPISTPALAPSAQRGPAPMAGPAAPLGEATRALTAAGAPPARALRRASSFRVMDESDHPQQPRRRVLTVSGAVLEVAEPFTAPAALAACSPSSRDSPAAQRRASALGQYLSAPRSERLGHWGRRGSTGTVNVRDLSGSRAMRFQPLQPTHATPLGAAVTVRAARSQSAELPLSSNDATAHAQDGSGVATAGDHRPLPAGWARGLVARVEQLPPVSMGLDGLGGAQFDWRSGRLSNGRTAPAAAAAADAEPVGETLAEGDGATAADSVGDSTLLPAEEELGGAQHPLRPGAQALREVRDRARAWLAASSAGCGSEPAGASTVSIGAAHIGRSSSVLGLVMGSEAEYDVVASPAASGSLREDLEQPQARVALGLSGLLGPAATRGVWE